MNLYRDSGIYQIRNILNGKIYIGSAKRFQMRFNTHLHSLRHNKHHSTKLQNAFNKYGESVFVFEVLEVVSRLENEGVSEFKIRLSKKYEQKYLNELLFADQDNNKFDKLGYNIKRIAQHSPGNNSKRHSEETNKRKSIAALNWYKNNPELKQKRTEGKSLNWLKQKRFKCEYCKRKLQQSLIKRHKTVCRKNPNRLIIKHSENRKRETK